MLLTVALSQRWNTTGNWLAVMVITVHGLLAPISTVKITDNLNRVDSSGWIVANVPLGLAFFAGVTSKAGHEMTQMFETNFADPNAPTLHDHGFLFGVDCL